MNSRMNFGNGFSIPQENDVQNRGHWMSLTPEKPIASRSSSIPVERQGNQIGGDQLERENWKDLMGFYMGFLQENRDHCMPLIPEKPIALRSSPIPVERQGNQLGGENWKELREIYMGFLQENRGHCMPLTPEKPIDSGSSSIPVERQGNQLGGENWKDLMGFYMGFLQENSGHCIPLTPEKPIALRSSPIRVERQGNQIGGNQPGGGNWKELMGHSQVCSNWAYLNYQNCPPNSNQWINGERVSYMPNDEFPVPCRPNYNLNSPPRSEANIATSSVDSSSEAA